jgi:aryl-alcohol dehydrogenase-like predicted oxidoreductase
MPSWIRRERGANARPWGAGVKVALGSVQWGMAYGVANAAGQPARAEVGALLALARSRGVAMIDTAAAYGEAEEVIGELVGADRAWTVITKTVPDLAAENDVDAVADRTRASLDASRRRLRRAHLDAVLLHRPEHRLAGEGAAWAVLLEQKRAGVIGRVGISAVTPADAWAALEEDTLDMMQVASSLVDRRLAEGGFFERAAERGVDVFVRSAFLQGLAFLAGDELPEGLREAVPTLELIDGEARALGVPRAALFVAWVCDLPATPIFGAERAEQIREVLDWVSGAADLAAATRALAQRLPSLPATVLEPHRWA